jgi:hypothetical protein
MSTAVLEAPVQSASQLCFAWADQPADVTAAQAAAAETAERARRRRARATPQAAPKTNHLVRKAESQPDCSSVECSTVTALPQVPAAPLAVRGGGEVRIGSVMIKLLKRYGITDQEIADGLASYAQKQCQSSAS